LVAGYKAGRTVYELADTLKISKTTVSKHLERQGVPRRMQSLNQEQVDKAIEMYGRGLSLAKIAPTLGCDPGTVRLALINAGVRTRDTQGRERD
jgi:DNA-directed RNA polymerase specialized sigma24 family protein